MAQELSKELPEQKPAAPVKEPMEQELEAPASFTSPEELYQDLITSIRRYHPSDDISLVEKAYLLAMIVPAAVPQKKQHSRTRGYVRVILRAISLTCQKSSCSSL